LYQKVTGSTDVPWKTVPKAVQRLILGLPFGMVNWLKGCAASFGAGESESCEFARLC
jgi:hypothetical protein